MKVHTTYTLTIHELLNILSADEIADRLKIAVKNPTMMLDVHDNIVLQSEETLDGSTYPLPAHLIPKTVCGIAWEDLNWTSQNGRTANIRELATSHLRNIYKVVLSGRGYASQYSGQTWLEAIEIELQRRGVKLN